MAGTYVDITLTMTYPNEFVDSGLKEGKYKLLVEEVRERDVVLRGRGFKLVIPYEKK